MKTLDGTWIYQSFHPSMAPPSPLIPWSPPAKLSVTTDASGKVEGTLAVPLPPEKGIPELVFTITGSITPASEGLIPVPEGVELKGTAGASSVNLLRGYFVGDGANPVVVGTITAVQNDPAGEPDGTSGPFVLVPVKAPPAFAPA